MRGCNPTLYRQMEEIVDKNKRKVIEIEEGSILPNGTIFYSDLLSNYQILFAERERNRKSWHVAALKTLKTADIVFLDPDNGTETEKMNLAKKYSPKHVLFQEIADYFERKQTIIIYNHKSRQEESIYQMRFRRLKDMKGSIRILRAHRGTARDFVFLIQPEHEEQMEHKILDFLKSDWGVHFEKVVLS